MPYCASCGNDVSVTDVTCKICSSDLTKDGARTEQPPAQSTNDGAYRFNLSYTSGVGETGAVQPTQGPNPQTRQGETTVPTSFASLHAELGPGERVVWQRDLKRGIIHRHVSMQERITNKRIFLYDLEDQRFAQMPMNDNFDAVVSNTRRDSRSVGGGTFGGGTFSGTRFGASRTVGDIEIMKDGVCRIRMDNVVDPHGVKNLIDAVKRESRTVGSPGR